MAPKRASAGRKLRGAQKWIVAELRGIPKGATLATANIASRIAKASGKKFHQNSVYNALRALVRRGEVVVTRKGVQKLYRIRDAVRPGPKPAASASAPMAPVPTETAAASAPAGAMMGSSSAPSTFPHKLALGEVLVLEVASDGVVTATNLHGKVVIEKHPLPA